MLHPNCSSPFRINNIKPISSIYMDDNTIMETNYGPNRFDLGEDEYNTLKEAFDLYDTCNRGFIDNKQFNTILNSLDFIDREKLARYLNKVAAHGSTTADTVNFDRFATTLIELLPTHDHCATTQTPAYIKSEPPQLPLPKHQYIDFDEKISINFEECNIESRDAGDEEIKACFQVFDLDNDGRISRKELEQVMARLGTHLTHQELKDMMVLGDKNKDGFIDLEEFKQLLPSPKYE